MLILTLKTSDPTSEIGLYNQNQKLDYFTWTANRQLATSIHTQINDLLVKNNQSLKDLNGIVCFEGPGSFTGLRIGLTVANTLSYGLQIPIQGATGENWIEIGIKKILKNPKFVPVIPKYGAPVHVTEPKH